MTERFQGGVAWNEAGDNSIYYRCADLTLSNSAANPVDMGGGTAPAPGGCSYGTALRSTPWGALLGLVLVPVLVLRRRKKSLSGA